MSDQVFQALADERRRSILRLIQNSELSAGEIAGHFDVTQPAISQHLRVLVEAQLVSMRRQGPGALPARPEGLVQVREFLDGFWRPACKSLNRLSKTRRGALNLMDATDQTVLERQIRISARPEVVFSFFTDPVKLIRWKAFGRIGPSPSGVYR